MDECVQILQYEPYTSLIHARGFQMSPDSVTETELIRAAMYGYVVALFLRCESRHKFTQFIFKEGLQLG